MIRNIRFRLEAWLISALLAGLGRLRPETASNLGGAIARTIGPHVKVSRVADANLRLAMPELGAAARTRIIRGCWDHLGRTAGEFPHAHALDRTTSGPGWELEGEEHAQAIFAKGGPAIFFSGHIGNWEVFTSSAASFGAQVATFYRAASNPLVDAIIVARRGAGGAPQFAKGANGARNAMTHLRAGGFLGMLVDQKMNDGIAVPFFGHSAMTAPAAAALAIRYGAKLVPVHAERIGPARLRLICEPPLAMPQTGDRHADIAALTLAMNQHLERWIRARPEQWLWLHRRWPKENTR